MFRPPMTRALMLAALSIWMLQCQSSEPSGPAGENGAGTSEPPEGEAVYREPFADGNTFSCATCHALSEPATDGFRRAGHSLGDAARRPDYKNGSLTELRDAVNTCVTEWMKAEALSVTDPRWTALEGLLVESAGDAPAQSVSIQIVPPPSDLTGGDPIEGMILFNASCAICHGADAVGTVRAPSLIGAKLDAALASRRVRTSGSVDSDTYPGLSGGIMPFFGADRLTDAEVIDLSAFVEEVGKADRTTVTGGTGENGRKCLATHPKVGATAKLSTFAHRVSGTARVADDCTIEIENFVYDGGGIDVHIYAGLGGEYDPPEGFSISENLLGMTFQNGTLRVQLPEGRTLDDVDGISVWCVPVGVSFGDGRFNR